MAANQLTPTRSIAEAKAHFAACVRAAGRGEPVIILRHGEPAAVLVADGEWERWRRAAAAAGSAGRACEALASRGQSVVWAIRWNRSATGHVRRMLRWLVSAAP